MEGAIIFASLVVGVAVTDQLASLHALLRRRREVRWDPLLLAVAALVTMTILLVWWTLSNAGAGTISIGAFLPWFLVLLLQFLMASASLPDRASEIDLRAYYAAESRYLWTLIFLAALVLNLTGLVALIEGGMRPWTLITTRWFEYVVLALMASAALIRKRWWHWVVVLVLWSGPIGWLSLEMR